MLNYLSTRSFMSLYKMIKILKANGFKYITFSPGKEIWEKDNIQLAIPTNKDTIHKQITRDLLAKIYG